MMGKKGAGILYYVFSLVILGFILFSGLLGGLSSAACASAGSLTGIDYFFYCNFTLWVSLVYLMAVFVVGFIFT